MPAEFILAIVCFVLAAIAWIVWRSIKRNEDVVAGRDWQGRRTAEQPRYTDRDASIARWIAVGITALALFLVLLSSIQVVGTKEVGVVTSFGSTDGHLGAGLGLTWPWENVTEMDGAIQTDKHNDFTIRIANQQTAFPDVKIRWRIVPGQADNLFQNYRSFDRVRDSLVTNELQKSLAGVLSDYNPLNSVQYGAPAQGAHNPSYSDLANQVRLAMKRSIGGQIEVLSVFMPFVGFDKETEAKLNALQQQIAQTRINVQLQQTNTALSKANNILAKSVNTSPNVLVAQCMTYLGDLVKGGGTIPPGFTCWPGNNVAGIIANTTK